MQLTINELLQGKPTLIKNKEYFSTEAYVTPFLERMSKYTDNFIIQAKLPDQISLTKKEDINMEDIVFNRVWIQAVMPEEYSFENHKEVVSLLYGLDTRKPVAKIFRGALNMACLNLCTFNPTFLNIQELEPQMPISFKCIEPLMSQTSDIKAWLDKLVDTEVPFDDVQINERLGSWVRHTINDSYSNVSGKIKLAANTAIDAYKLLYETKDSPYYVGKGNSTNMFNVYNAWTQIITNDTRDIMNKFEKTLLLKNILELS